MSETSPQNPIAPLQQGSVMMLSGTLTPESVPLGLQPYWQSWSAVGSSLGQVLDKDLRAAGWNFFFLAGSISSCVVGKSGEPANRRAMQSVLAKVKPAGFNCVEVADITAGRFCGVPYVRLTVNSRHVQKSCMLDSLLRRLRKNATAALGSGLHAQRPVR